LWNTPTTFKARRDQKGNRTIHYLLWNTSTTFKARRDQGGYGTIPILIWEYANNLPGQKRPGRIKDDSICSCLFMYVGMKAGQQSR
jgi:hypothetical protein